MVRRRRRRLEETKARAGRDDMEDCDVAANQLTEAPSACLTVLPQCSLWRLASAGVRSGPGVAWSAQGRLLW